MQKQIGKIKPTTVILSILCILGVIFLFINGFFTYYWLSDFSYGGISYEMYKTSFVYLIENAAMWQLYPIIICTALVVVLATAWIQIIGNKSIRYMGSVSSAIALAAFVVGTIAGINSFFHNFSTKYLHARYFDKLNVLFYFEILILISILILSCINDYRTYKHKM